MHAHCAAAVLFVGLSAETKLTSLNGQKTISKFVHPCSLQILLSIVMSFNDLPLFKSWNCIMFVHKVVCNVKTKVMESRNNFSKLVLKTWKKYVSMFENFYQN